jgi:hypothetical protein
MLPLSENFGTVLVQYAASIVAIMALFIKDIFRRSDRESRSDRREVLAGLLSYLRSIDYLSCLLCESR